MSQNRIGRLLKNKKVNISDCNRAGLSSGNWHILQTECQETKCDANTDPATSVLNDDIIILSDTFSVVSIILITF